MVVIVLFGNKLPIWKKKVKTQDDKYISVKFKLTEPLFHCEKKKNSFIVLLY